MNETPMIGLSSVHIPSPTLGRFHGPDQRRDLPVFECMHGTGPVFLEADPPRWVTARVWRGGISVGTGIHPRAPHARGDVVSFSEGSAKRMLRYLQEAEADYGYMGTLTVAGDFSSDGDAFREAVDRFLVWFQRAQRRAAGDDRDRVSIFWWVEFQARGAPHLHFFFTHFVPWQEAAGAWARACVRVGLCPIEEERKFIQTSTRLEKLRGGWRAACAYARKYARKTEQKQVPEGYSWHGRWWGVRGLRSRVSCHVCRGYEHGEIGDRGIRKSLDEAVDRGQLRRIRWEKGDGATYFLPRGMEWEGLPDLQALIYRFMVQMLVGTEPDATQVLHQAEQVTA